MNALPTISELLDRIDAADLLLQKQFQRFREEYFQFLGHPNMGGWGGTRHLRIALQKDSTGRVRRIGWTRRIDRTRRVKGRLVYMNRPLPGPFRREWVYRIAKDWARVKQYDVFGKRARTLNSMRSQLINARRRIRLAFRNKWALLALDREVEEASQWAKREEDQVPLSGVVAFSRHLLYLEIEIGRLVDEWPKTGGLHVPFYPRLRNNPNLTTRLFWGIPWTDGYSKFTQYIPTPTDREMRRQGIPLRARKEVRAFLRRLNPLQRQYRDLCMYLSKLHRRARIAIARVNLFCNPYQRKETSCPPNAS